MERAADFISAHCTQPLRLADIAAACRLSPSYLVRSFKARYGLTPHAYQINRRIQFGKRELQRGRPIVEVALDAGFADQAHFQRAFKRHVAATPGQYMRRGVKATIAVGRRSGGAADMNGAYRHQGGHGAVDGG
nr:AraC family transcriptional regulator [Azospirillum sp. INR13]